jgi:flagellar protein FlgJ
MSNAIKPPGVSPANIISTKSEMMPTRKIQSNTDEQIRQAAELYETQFMNEMVKAMRKTVPESEFMAPSMAQKIYREQLDSQNVEAWVERGGIGLADIIEQQIREKSGLGPVTPAAAQVVDPAKMYKIK